MSIAIAFNKIESMVGVSDFRAAISSYLRKARVKPLVVATGRGMEQFVVLSADAYNRLIEAREDAIDARELERLVKKGGKMRPWKKR